MALTFPGLSQILRGLNNAPGMSKRQTREADAKRLQQLAQTDRDRFEFERFQEQQATQREQNDPILRQMREQELQASQLANQQAQQSLTQQQWQQQQAEQAARQAAARKMQGITGIQGLQGPSSKGAQAFKPIDPMAQLNERMAREQAAQMGLQTRQMRQGMQGTQRPQLPRGGAPSSSVGRGGGAPPVTGGTGTGGLDALKPSTTPNMQWAGAGGGGGGLDPSLSQRQPGAGIEANFQDGRSLTEEAAKRKRLGLTGQQSPSGPLRRPGGGINVGSSRPGAGRR